MFENLEVAIDDLPNAEALKWQPLHPPYVRHLQVQHALVALGPLVAATLVTILRDSSIGFTVAVWLAVVASTALLLWWPTQLVPRRGYVVRDKDLLFRAGVIWRSVTAIPYNRIQHVETSNTPLDRKFGVATLQLYTAGGTGGDLQINGLRADIAEQLRVFVLKKAGANIEHA